MLSSSIKSHEKRNELNYQNDKKRIGIFGGTFDPIHLAHLIAAEAVYSAMNLDELWFMPAKIPPHKQDRNILASEHRLRMLHLAIEWYPEFKVNTYELEQNDVSYTYNTIVHFTTLFPKHQFYFIVGEDMVEMLPKWYRYEDLLPLVSFVAVHRPGSHIPIMDPLLSQIEFIDMPQMELSSTYIRNRCLSGRSIRFMVPDRVFEYIKEHQLYVD